MASALRARGPGARGSRITASRYALGAEGGRLRVHVHVCSPRNCNVTAHVVSRGEWGCRRRRALRAAREARCKACFELLPRARVGWHTTRTLLPPPPPRSSGAPVRWLMARGRRASVVGAAPRSRAAGAPGHAPSARRGRRVRVPRSRHQHVGFLLCRSIWAQRAQREPNECSRDLVSRLGLGLAHVPPRVL